MSRLGLGTVQFGMPYGITNACGQVPADEVSRILALSQRAGIGTLDTAALYGESEAVLGGALAQAGVGNAFRIVTKTAKIGDWRSERDAIGTLTQTFTRSLRALRQTSVYGLLAHDADDLLGPHGPALWAELSRLKASGAVRKIGASVYTGNQIDRLLGCYDLDLIQLPINAVDRRLIAGGQLARLQARGVEIHARSVFLQGLLLARPEEIADHFEPLRESVAGLRAAFAKLSLTPLEGALAAVVQQREVDCILIGVTSIRELSELVAAADKAAAMADVVGVEAWAIADERVLSPHLWASPMQTRTRTGTGP
jgi:aryl-alcohol dehydrogenase-like predicted oxidoreductase